MCDKDSQLELVDSQRWVIFGPAGVVLSDDTGLHTLDSHADVARVTADGESLLTAQNNTVQLLNWDGTVRVQRTINGVFKSIERLGSSGHFAVTMDTPQGPRYAQMDASLEWVVTQPIPEASSIAVSKNGNVIAFILPDAVHFYENIVGH